MRRAGVRLPGHRILRCRLAGITACLRINHLNLH
jgi:hypothetical protein